MSLPKIFFGSSGQSLELIKHLADLLSGEFSCTTWDSKTFFPEGHDLLTSLEKGLDAFDMAVFVFDPTDQATVRGKLVGQPRDTVVFEAGFSIAKLGRDRTIVFLPKDHRDFRLMTDFQGIVHPKIDFARYSSEPNNPELLAGAVATIRSRWRAVKGQQTSGVYVPRLDESTRTFLELSARAGLTHAWKKRSCALSNLEKDIGNARNSVTFVTRVYHSELFKRPNDFASALVAAASKMADGASPLEVSFYSTNWKYDFGVDQEASGACPDMGFCKTWPSNNAVLQQLFTFESTQNVWRNRWDDMRKYIDHMKEKSSTFDAVQSTICEQYHGLADKLVFKRDYVHDLLLPYSLVMIDDRIVYASFYTLNDKETYGSSAPTIRAEARSDQPLSNSGKAGDHWVQLFQDEIEKLKTHYMVSSHMPLQQ